MHSHHPTSAGPGLWNWGFPTTLNPCQHYWTFTRRGLELTPTTGLSAAQTLTTLPDKAQQPNRLLVMDWAMTSMQTAARVEHSWA